MIDQTVLDAHKRELLTSQIIENTRELPLSFAQTKLLFNDKFELSNNLENIFAAFRLTGSLNVSVLKQSLNEIVHRHEILRTTFATIDDQVIQIIAPSLTLTLPLVDWQQLSKEEQLVEVQKLATEEIQQPFDLTNKPLLRATLVRLEEQSHMLLLTMHHIISDSCSMRVFVQEIATLYSAFSIGKPSPLADLSIQYTDFAQQQRERLTEEILKAQLDYWKQQLADASPVLELPTDYPRLATQTYRGARKSQILPEQLTESLKALSLEKEVTLFTLLLTAFKTLLYRYTSQEDILVGTPIANRNLETKQLIGLFANTLVLRTQFQSNPTFSKLLEQVQETTLRACDNQDIPFEKLVEELQPVPSLSYTPLFQVMFVMENAPMGKLELPGLSITPLELDNVTGKFDLTLSIAQTESGLVCGWKYNSDLFEASTIERMAANFEMLLSSIVANPQQQIAQLPILSEFEQQQLLQWNSTSFEYPQNQCFPQLFEELVAHNPNAVAVVYQDQQLTYQELNARANRWARHLVTLGVQAETIVALLCDRNIDFLTAMLAVFKAGGAYLPLNPDHPPERIHQVLEQSQVPLVLSAKRWASLVSSLDTLPELMLLEDLDCFEYSAENLPVRSYPENLAYVIYTSGSTGKPKGAMLEHRGMLNHLYAKVKDLQLGGTDAVAQTATQTFDISIWQFLVASLVGGRVEIVPSETVADPIKLLSLVERQRISILEIVPSLLRMMVQQFHAFKPELSKLRWLLLTGEALPPQLCRQWLEYYPSIPMMNAYGPTECSDDVTHYPIFEPPHAEVVNLPIGRPVSNTQLYILNTELQPVPIGVAGELYVGGDAVGRGYLNNPTLTQKAFISNPFAKGAGACLYKTGDLARYLADGNIEFIGRIDYQVKIRGFRIELGEVEAVLSQHPQVREVVVIAREDQPGNQLLVGYIVPNFEVGLTTHELRDFLTQKLPEYMVPSAFVMLEYVPLTPNGKVDRRALPAPEIGLGLELSFVAPRTLIEEVLAGIWVEVLKVERVGIHDNFLELGGHSLLAIQLISRVRDTLGVELPLRSLFEAPTVMELAQYIEAQQQNPKLLLPPIEPVERTQNLPLSFGQEQLWVLDQLVSNVPVYNEPATIWMPENINVVALEKALNEIVNRHEILRTTYRIIDGQLMQVIAPYLTLPLPVVDLRSLPTLEREAEALRLATQEARQPFDLTSGPLLRATLMRLDETDCRLYVTTHHSIDDGISSYSVFFPELQTLYRAFCAGKPSPLKEVRIQYADFAVWQRQCLQSEVLESQISYWKQQLANLPVLELLTDHPRGTRQTFVGSRQCLALSRNLSDELLALSRREGVTLFMTLLAAFNTLLYRYTGSEDIPVGTVTSNRNRPEIEETIGFFLNTLVLRTDLSGNPSFQQLLKRVREVTLEADARRDLPFEHLVQILQPERSLSHNPLFQVSFVLEPPIPTLDSGWKLSQLDVDTGTTKFDLTLELDERPEGIIGRIEYNTDLYEDSTISGMIGHYQTLLEGIVANPQKRISELPLLTQAERQQLLVEWNDTANDHPQDKCIHQLFEEQVELTPDAVAVVFVDERSEASGTVEQQLTYRELNAKANQLAHYLRSLGVKPEVLVGICVERSLEMIVGLLAILKAGGAYVPLDPAYPEERLSFMLSDSQVSVLLTQQKLVADLPENAAHVISLDADWGVIAEHNQTNPSSGVQASNLAYMIYTSGSTGKPKGVLVPHQGLCNLALAQIHTFDVHCDSRVLQFASFSFDASISEVVMTLCSGAQLYLGTRESLLPGSNLMQLLHKHAITHVTLPPSALAAMPTVEYPDLRTIIVAGEACHPDLVAQWSRGRRFVNGYGPTEATVCTTTAVCTEGNYQLPIGRPISNAQVYILDRHLQPVPIGVAGELHIGGVGVARGYLNRPELTKEKFIPNPFKGSKGETECNSERLYKTGDLVRYLPDGNIEFLGRIDDQVKIRGFRIELGEIEAVLNQQPQVREAVVIAKEEQPGNKRLVAYIVPNEPLTNSELRSFLCEKLTDYMVPSAFVMLESLPLTPNGKVDRKALSALDLSTEWESTFVPPRTPVEEILAGIWAEILGVEQVGIYHNFFELGGHSLLGTQVISRVHDCFQLKLSLRTLFEHQTIADLALTIVQQIAVETEEEEMDRILAELEQLDS
ncbi:non-ribosomal peptide synthetase [Aetokthonos hydrillicola Thurmond2011]|jgi:amino acid adenylation domain-containing protein|uniref:Non-ribosomal peptide synthetase n=1 Tax=Aetokthonos hydrillicola Thurmond2011 TaxID=2712845 RepID=A0AAP5IAK7_9CYAN|nr:non-ribosomal peptide synthetase [Aetokthonos hydrillicola]MBO3462192.1 amino acid adenylation domain-containing protein [Aetokthonos hydrillicola CCALA 1050]MBW4588560.1 amino acid adenylation domain-containing protein [Aetokthonos hydrillicola CCALA 1050]MDR9896233.1 non-ribosomal peptide synthetase [Aetokthonos hydrillicola Thurmond2011]